MKSSLDDQIHEIPHTADVSIKITADSLENLFIKAAKGMYTLTGIEEDRFPLTIKEFSLSGIDYESLLVAFLSELLYYLEKESIAFHQFEIRLTSDSILCSLAGFPIKSIRKIIKAVTFHNLRIISTCEGFETTLVFDV